MPEYDTHDWAEFLEARNELEAANEFHIGLMDKYTSVTTVIQPGQPLTVTTKNVQAEIEAAEERVTAARERLRQAQERLGG